MNGPVERGVKYNGWGRLAGWREASGWLGAVWVGIVLGSGVTQGL